MLEAIVVEQARLASIADTRPAPAHITQRPAWLRPVTAQCIVDAANRQNLELIKVLGVMKAESGRVGQFVRNRNGSYDIGPMQINTVHLQMLAKTYGVSTAQVARQLAYDGCFNVSVGAWLLRIGTNKASGDFWYGVGRYHSATTTYSRKYILRVHAAIQEMVKKASASPVSSQASIQATGSLSSEKAGYSVQ